MCSEAGTETEHAHQRNLFEVAAPAVSLGTDGKDRGEPKEGAAVAAGFRVYRVQERRI